MALGYVLLEGSRDPVRVRAAYISDADIDAMAANFTDTDENRRHA